MGQLRLIPPDGTDWTIDAVPTPDGVELAIAFTLQGQPITARFVMESLGRPDPVRRPVRGRRRRHDAHLPPPADPGGLSG